MEDIIKPELDDRLYRHIQLNNGLQALLISDSLTETAAASMDIEVGHFSDPEDIPGLAHFLEHMLFLGSEKYPEESGINKFLTEHGGRDNAFTSTEHTNYYFSVNSNYLEEALDRYAQFFIAPLFNESSVDREINAVHSENAKNFQQDNWRFYQLQKSTSNPKHPFSKFATGNSSTLNVPGVRDRLRELWEKHYSAPHMRLAVLGKEPLDTLEEWIRKYYEDIPNRNTPLPFFKGKPFTEEHVRRKLYMVPVKDLRSLRIVFPLESLRSFYEKAPNRLLSHLLGHEAPGSLLALLKKKGWAEELLAGLSRDNRTFCLFKVEIDLTVEGMKHIDEIIALTFQYIKLIEKEGVQKWIYDETQSVEKMMFRFKQKATPINYVKNLAGDLHEYKPQHVLVGPYLCEEFDEPLIRQILSSLNPNNVCVYILGKEFESIAKEEEKWYGTKYTIEPLSDEFVKQLEDVSLHPELHLPTKNEFITTDFALRPVIEEDLSESPQLISEDSALKVWHKQDTTFKVPRMNVYMTFASPVLNETPLSAVMSSLYEDLLEDSLVEMTYYADIADLSIGFDSSTTEFNILASGFSEKVPTLVKQTFERVNSFEVNEERFRLLKEKKLRTYANFRKSQSYRISRYALNRILRDVRWTIEEKEEALKEAIPQDLTSFVSRMRSPSAWELLLHGNLTRRDALDLIEDLRKIFTPEPLPSSHYPSPRIVCLPSGKIFTHRFEGFNPEEKNSAIYNLYQIGVENTKDDVLVSLFTQIHQTTFYDQLRTREQLGYIVWSGPASQSGIHGFKVEVVSPSHDPIALDERIENCMSMCNDALKEMTQEEFEKFVEILCQKKLEKLKRLKQETDRHWDEITYHKYEFNRVENEAAALRKLTLQELRDFVDRFLFNPNTRAKLSIQNFSSVHWKAFQEAEVRKGENLITDIDAFKRSMPLYPCNA